MIAIILLFSQKILLNLIFCFYKLFPNKRNIINKKYMFTPLKI